MDPHDNILFGQAYIEGAHPTGEERLQFCYCHGMRNADQKNRREIMCRRPVLSERWANICSALVRRQPQSRQSDGRDEREREEKADDGKLTDGPCLRPLRNLRWRGADGQNV